MADATDGSAEFAAAIAAMEAGHKEAQTAADRHAARVRELNERYGRFAETVEKATKRNRDLAKSLADGSFARQANEVARLNREYVTLERQARLTTLVADHGKFGAVLRNNAREINTIRTAALGTVGAFTAMGVGLARSGLAGTVEGYKLEYAWLRLSRSVASIAVPAVDALSNHLGKAAGWFEQLNGSQQDTILKIGLLTAGTLALGGALRTVVAVGGAAIGILRGVAAVSGLSALAGGAAAGGTTAVVGGAAAGAATAAGAGGAAAAGGAGLLARLGGGAAGLGAVAGLGAAGAATGYGSEVVGLGAAYGAVSGYRAGTGALRGVARVAGPLAAGASVYEGATGGYYSRARSEGHSMFTSGLAALGGGALDTLTLGAFGDYHRKKYGTGDAAGGPRSEITPLRVASGEAGMSHALIQEEVLKVTTAMADETKAAAEETKKTREVMEKLTVATEAHTAALITAAEGLPGGFGGPIAEHFRRVMGR